MEEGVFGEGEEEGEGEGEEVEREVVSRGRRGGDIGECEGVVGADFMRHMMDEDLVYGWASMVSFWMTGQHWDFGGRGGIIISYFLLLLLGFDHWRIYTLEHLVVLNWRHIIFMIILFSNIFVLITTLQKRRLTSAWTIQILSFLSILPPLRYMYKLRHIPDFYSVGGPQTQTHCPKVSMASLRNSPAAVQPLWMLLALQKAWTRLGQTNLGVPREMSIKG